MGAGATVGGGVLSCKAVGKRIGGINDVVSKACDPCLAADYRHHRLVGTNPSLSNKSSRKNLAQDPIVTFPRCGTSSTMSRCAVKAGTF